MKSRRIWRCICRPKVEPRNVSRDPPSGCRCGATRGPDARVGSQRARRNDRAEGGRQRQRAWGRAPCSVLLLAAYTPFVGGYLGATAGHAPVHMRGRGIPVELQGPEAVGVPPRCQRRRHNGDPFPGRRRGAVTGVEKRWVRRRQMVTRKAEVGSLQPARPDIPLRMSAA